MTAYCALLRAVNVGGHGRLAMSDLKTICEGAGFGQVRTYIQSGNVVFASEFGADAVEDRLTQALATHLGAPVDVMVRTALELAAIRDANPFSGAPPNFVMVQFLTQTVAPEALAAIARPGGERLSAHGREVFAYYPDGVGRSKLRLDRLGPGTARNINTVNALIALLEGVEG